MIELARHIEILLLENDCVIIPDFGGFIAHYQPARYIKEENLYLPPVRTIGFNPQLTINDGLLVQSYMQAHHTDFPDATRMIEEEVAGLKEQLYQNGCAEMHGIGVLHYNIHSTYEFHPNEDGALSPTLYGLSSFSINRLEYLTSTTSAATRELLPRQEKRKRTVRFKRQWIGNAVAVAIAVVLFFFLSVPVENTYVDKGNYASLGTDGLFDAIRSQSLATTLVTVPSRPQQPKKTNIKNNQNTLKPVTVKVEKVGKAQEAVPKNTVAAKLNSTEQPVAKPVTVSKPALEKKETATPSSSKKNKYYIIVSSLPTANDAQHHISGQKGITIAVYLLSALRILLCLFPQNAWTSADAPLSWGILRNIPFALLGLLIIVLFYQSAKKHNDRSFGWMWLTIVLSFGFYIPVVLWADVVPMIGMLMIPKTCAYVWTVLIGFKAMKASTEI